MQGESPKYSKSISSFMDSSQNSAIVIDDDDKKSKTSPEAITGESGVVDLSSSSSTCTDNIDQASTTSESTVLPTSPLDLDVSLPSFHHLKCGCVKSTIEMTGTNLKNGVGSHSKSIGCHHNCITVGPRNIGSMKRIRTSALREMLLAMVEEETSNDSYVITMCRCWIAHRADSSERAAMGSVVVKLCQACKVTFLEKVSKNIRLSNMQWSVGNHCTTKSPLANALKSIQ